MCVRCGNFLHRPSADGEDGTASAPILVAQDFGPTQGNPSWSSVALPTGSVAALIGGERWGTGTGTTTITYSFMTAGSLFVTGGGYGTPSTGGAPWDAAYRGFTATERTAMRSALAAWSAVADIRFVEVADDTTTAGDLRIGVTGYDMQGASAYAYFPGGSPISGDIWFRPSTLNGRPLDPGSFAFMVMLHEIGHALGLKHPFSAQSDNPAILSADLDQSAYTVMAYNTSPGFQGDLTTDVVTPMSLDVAAVQRIYGANAATRTGNDVYDFDGTRQAWLTLWDAGGTDTLRYVGTTGAVVDLTAGTWSQLGAPISDGRTTFTRTVFIADGVVIENFTGGAGNDTVTGNAAANRIEGGGGNDTISAGAGNDILVGGPGNDILDGGAGTDTAVFARNRADYTVVVAPDGSISVSGVNEGTDTLRGMEMLQFADAAFPVTAFGIDGSFGLASLGDSIWKDGTAAITDLPSWYPVITVTMTGTATDDLLTGSIGDDVIRGFEGSDIIHGGAGNDILIGGSGNDVLYGGDGNDVLVGGGDIDGYDGGQGTDIVVYRDGRFSYRLSHDGAGIQVTFSDERTETLASVERLQFADGTLAFDVLGAAGQAYRLYRAAFARSPDLNGLGFQTRVLDGGITLIDVANNFISSPEFIVKYGNSLTVTNESFIILLYNNVLTRSPDPSGLSFHIENLSRGLSRADLLVQFSESVENQVLTNSAVNNGIWFI